MKPWVFECVKKCFGEKELRDSLQKLNRQVFDVSYKPYCENIEYPEDWDIENSVIKTSIELSQVIQKNLLRPRGLFMDYRSCQMTAMKALTKDFVNIDGETCLAKDLDNAKWDLYSRYSVDTNIFVKPNDTDKKFAAQLVDLRYFGSFVSTLNPEWEVFVAKPKHIRAEFRILMCNNKPATSSLYKWDGNDTYVKNAPQKVLDFAEQCAKIHSPLDPIFVSDVAIMEDNSLKIIEYNPFASSAMYACDKNIVINVAENCF